MFGYCKLKTSGLLQRVTGKESPMFRRSEVPLHFQNETLQQE
jgi:hypothetical protein